MSAIDLEQRAKKKKGTQHNTTKESTTVQGL